jgi:NAD(P)-dependent dehydrogenase (short-subunit alcohol dehydrogenase family)
VRVDGISALVTGAASGLGAATAAALTDRGAAVVGLDLPSQLAGKTDLNPAVRYVGGSVTDEDDVLVGLEAIGAIARPLRLVVNCAGIAPAQRLLSSRGAHDLALFKLAVEVNLVGSFNVMRLTAAAMAATEPLEDGQRGLIVNTASISAFEGQIGQVAYAASKGGVVGMTLPAARDLARSGIRVNTIAPGIVDTPLLAALGPEVNASLAASVPFPARLGKPAEYARLVLMLAEHDYLNAETIRMDGALRMAPQ